MSSFDRHHAKEIERVRSSMEEKERKHPLDVGNYSETYTRARAQVKYSLPLYKSRYRNSSRS